MNEPFTLELLKNGLQTISDEMAVTVARTARSFVVKEALDFSTALFDEGGTLISQGTCLPLHLGSMPSAVEAVRNRYGSDLHPGDIFALNDPYEGGTHLPDIICVQPVFLAQDLVGFSTTLAHQTDIGGRVPGGNASDSTEIYQEGLRIPPLRLFSRGEPNETLFRLLSINVRVPDKVLGDVRSQVAACRTGERRLMDLIRRVGGIAPFRSNTRALLDYTERFTRSELSKLPDGRYEFVDYLDGDGIEPGVIEFRVAITVEGDHMTVDFTGTSPQVRGAINSVYSFTASAAWACVRSILDRDVPNNAGFFRPIEVIAPKGTIVNPLPPAPVAARGLTGFRIADTVFGALAKIRPDLVPASGSSSPDAGVSFGGYAKDGKPFVFLEFLVGSWGGGPDRDGMDACTGMIINYSNTPAELLETEQPLRVDRYAFVPDSGGEGRYRGGLAMERHLRVLADEAILQIRSDRRDVPPYGLEGGATGAPSSVSILRADGEEHEYPAKFLTNVYKGDVLKVRLAGGGGYGNPLSRPPESVLEDVIHEKISAVGAARDYGVAIRGTPPRIDADETLLLRKRGRATP